MSMLLSADELNELTGHRRSDAQARALGAMGIPFAARPNGTLAVLRAVAELALGGAGTMTTPAQREPELHL